MTTVGVREFKDKLSQYLRRVASGERVIVTDRGRPLAVVAPPEPTGDDEGVRLMVREGLARWSGGRPRGGPSPRPDQGQADSSDGPRGPALRLYLDTSALLKLYVDEEGANLLQSSRTSAEIVATSLLTLVEARAALARRRRAGDVSSAAYRHALGELAHDWERYVRIEVSESLVVRAASLAEAHRLRGYDAIHLASALLLSDRLGGDTVFASWDDALDAAAAREGLRLLRGRRR